MSPSPPKWTLQFLRAFCREELLEEIEGDLYELFMNKVERSGARFARRTFLLDVLKFFRWSNLKYPTMGKLVLNPGLWVHHFKIAVRVIQRNALFSTINVSGLALGILCFSVLLVYYLQESSYDTFFPEHENIYRIASNVINDGQFQKSAKCPVPLSGLLEGNLAQQATYARMMPWLGFVRYEQGERYKESHFVFADKEMSDIFSMEVIQGSLEEVLQAPMNVAITESKARQYFGNENPIGKVLTFEEDGDQVFQFHVGALIRDIPENSHLKVEFISGFESLDQMFPWHDNWFYPRTYLYVKFSDSAGITDFERLAQQQLLDKGDPDFIEDQPELVLQALTDIHLTSDRVGEWKPNNTQINIHFFLLLGFFILLIAVINYVNLTTANHQQRTREMGIKQAMGASKKQITWQFFIESFSMIALAMVISAALLLLVWASFLSTWLQSSVALDLLFQPRTIIGLLLGMLTLSGLVGLYPSWIALRYSPVDVIRNNLGKYMSKGTQRKVLVSLQFSMAMAMILFTILLMRQYHFLRDKPAGYEVNYRVALQMIDDHDTENYLVLKEQLRQLPFVENIAVSSTVIGLGDGFHGFNFEFPDRSEMSAVELSTLGVDEDYLTTMNIQMKKGRAFSREFAGDEKEAFILNETAVRQLGGISVGESVEMTIYTGRAEKRKGKVIGIVEDFHYQSLYENIKPLVLYINKHKYYTDFLNIELNPGKSVIEQVRAIESVYASFNPNKPMELIFLEDEIANIYQRELTGGQIMIVFTIMSVFIAALGAFGLATYLFRKRTREIGVRKVLGASRREVTIFVTREYVILIGVACLVSWPFVNYFSKIWLSNFAYTIRFGVENYLLGLVVLLLIVLLSNIQQILWSIKLNPVDYLRDE